LLTLIKQGSTYDEALIEAYGFDVAGLDTRWRESLVTSPVIVASEMKQSHPALIAGLSLLRGCVA